MESAETTYRKGHIQGHPVLGNLMELRNDPLGFFDRCRLEGDIVCFRLAHRRVFGVHHPDLVKQVLLKDYEHFVKRGIYSRLRPVFRKGLITSMGALWRRQRRTLQPMFSSKNMHSLISTIETEVCAFRDKLLEKSERGETIDLFEEMLEITLNIVTATMFSSDVSAKHREVSRHVYFLNTYVTKLLYSITPPMTWFPTKDNMRYHASMRALDSIILEMVEKRRQAGEPGTDLLGMLLTSKDPETGEKMSLEQIRDEAVTMFIAGHETTATALTWTFYLLDRHRSIRDRVAAISDETLPDNGRGITYEQVRGLGYLESVFLESMRCHCAVPLIYREATKACTLGGYDLKPRDTVYVSPYVSNQDERFWERPEVFDPERFLEPSSQQISKFLFFPFGAGPRASIGSRFATLESQLILGILGQSLNLVAGSRDEAVPEALVTMKPRDPIIMSVERR